MKKILFILICTVLGLTANAQKLTTNVGKVADGYNFWLYTPDPAGKEIQKKPVVIFLHGASLCGRDLNKVRRYGTISALEKGRKIDAYVIAPQNPGGAWKPTKIMNILKYVSSLHNVDPDRVYVLGMSLGGYGTIDFAAAYPDKVAAAIGMCGGSTSKNLGNLNDVPLWIIHGTGDRAVSVRESDKVVAGMRAANGSTPRLVYDRIPGMNHSQPARMFYLKETYDWLFAHSLKDKNRSIVGTFEPQAAMRGAYRDLRGARRQLIAGEASGKPEKPVKNTDKKLEGTLDDMTMANAEALPEMRLLKAPAIEIKSAITEKPSASAATRKSSQDKSSNTVTYRVKAQGNESGNQAKKETKQTARKTQTVASKKVSHKDRHSLLSRKG